MPTLVAQATTPTGASNTSSFQPATRNPQSTSTELLPQASGLQPTSQDQLLQNRSARITVPSQNAETAPRTASSAQANVINPWLVIGIAMVVLAVVLWRRFLRPEPVVKLIQDEKSQPILEPIAIPETAIRSETPRREPLQATKKPAPKKSKSQRKKKARR